MSTLENNGGAESDGAQPNVVRHQTAARALREHFIRWQCRARQNAVRRSAGRPSASMCPVVTVDGVALGQIVMLVNKQHKWSRVPEFRHMVLRTQDPRKRRESGLEFLAAEYYQRSAEFSDRLTALFGSGDVLGAHLFGNGSCRLEFNQTRQVYSLPCRVRKLDVDSYLYQATYWHNRLFNPMMPPGVEVLEFEPDWSRTVAEPGPL